MSASVTAGLFARFYSYLATFLRLVPRPIGTMAANNDFELMNGAFIIFPTRLIAGNLMQWEVRVTSA